MFFIYATHTKAVVRLHGAVPTRLATRCRQQRLDTGVRQQHAAREPARRPESDYIHRQPAVVAFATLARLRPPERRGQNSDTKNVST